MTVYEEKRQEPNMYNSIFNQMQPLDGVSDIEYEIGLNLREQSSLVNFQVWYLRDKDWEGYLENGLELSQLRLRVHELGNLGLPPNMIIPVNEILKEKAFLTYIDEHHLEFQMDAITSSQYLVEALGTISGFVFLLFILMFASEILIFEARHKSVLKGIPLSFMSKVHSKVMVSFICISLFLLVGFGLGGLFAAWQSSPGDFAAPVVIYQGGEFIAISTLKFYLLVMIGFFLVTVFLLYLTVLLNIVFKNAYATIMFGLGVFFIPDIFSSVGLHVSWLHTIKLIDIHAILLGNSTVQYSFSQIDYTYALIAIFIATLIIISVIYGINKKNYLEKFKQKEPSSQS
ncbi:hypothetical protein [Alkalihalobacillus alcalophilus]|nr:hypothetical protein [Alkalihalobacillus alcalophilus]